MPNLTGMIAEGHSAGRIGFAQTGGFAAGGSTSLADLSAGRGDKIISVLVMKGGYVSATAGFAANASSPIGSKRISGGISASRNDQIESVVAFGSNDTYLDINSASLSVVANRLKIASATTANRTVMCNWYVGNFANRKIPAGSVTISATRLKISDIATNGHSLAVRWWKGQQA